MKIKNSTSERSASFITFAVSFSSFYLFLLLQRLVVEVVSPSSFIPVYLPAGVLFVVILVGGVVGTFGVFCSLVPSYIMQNPNTYWLVVAGLVAFSMLIQISVVKLTAWITNVGPNLERLTHLKLIGFALVFSISHSLNHHLNLVVITKKNIGWAESRLAVSTFLGVFCVLALLWIVAKITNHFSQSDNLISL